MRYYNSEINFLKTLIQANEINKKSNLSAFKHILIRLFIQILLLFTCIYFIDINIIFFLLFSILYFFCFSFFGMAGISHELLHNNVFVQKKLNNFFFKFFMILTFNNYGYFMFTHWAHHKNTLQDDDPKDLFKGELSKRQLFFWIFLDFPAFMNRIKILTKNSFGIMPQNTPVEKRESIKFSARVVLLTQGLLLILFLKFNLFSFIFFLTLAPFTFTFFNKILAINQHYKLNNLECDKDDHAFNSRTIILNKYVSFLYANMNYHIEHHYFPAIPFYNLPRAHRLVYDNLEYNNLEVGLIESFKRLKII